jgi:hypothetical protein
MKLAEALNLRSDLQKRVAALRKRVVASSVVQEGEQPAEDPVALIDKCGQTLDSLEQLTCAINRVNCSYRTPQGQTLTELLARRDNLLQLHAVLNDAVEGTRRDPDRFGLREIKWVSLLDVAGLHDRCDDLGRQIRELNNTIQAINWQVDME